MIDPRQDKWFRDKLQWIFGFVQLEAEPFDIWPYWYKGTPPGATASVFKSGLKYRTVFMTDSVDEAPTEIEGWKFDRVLHRHAQETMCPGRFLTASGLVEAAQTVQAPKFPTGTMAVCPYCEKKQGDRHATISLDGKWVEVVYSRPSEET